MIRYKLVVSPFAELDLLAAIEWYNLQEEGLGGKFINEVENTIMRIQSNPLMYSKVKKQIRMGIVKKFPFGIYYFVQGEVINIFAIFHFSRNPKILKRRNK